MHKNLIKTILVIIITGVPYSGHTQQTIAEDDKAIFSLIYENDIFGGTDRNYTNGFRVAMLSSEQNTPKTARWLAENLLPFSSGGRKRIGVAIGHNIYTPAHLERSNLIGNERPYAGWLYGSVGIVSDTGKRLDNIMLSAGIVGPGAKAKEIQESVHHITDSPIAQGWDNQLHDELGIVLTMERKLRALYEFSPYGMGVDFTPHIGINLGNVNTDASVGATMRLGYDLPSDYGPPRIRPSLPGSDFFVPSKKLGGYLFAGFEGRAVARNIFLDGNTFRDSHSVDKEIIIGNVQTGIAMIYENTRLSYTHIFMTKEFKEQRKAEQFGAVTISYRF